MAELTVDMTYASALYQAAKDKELTEQVMDDCRGFLDVLKENDEFNRFLLSPAVSQAEKKQVLTKLLTGKSTDIFRNFICVLIDKHRVNEYARIVRSYQKLFEEKEGVIDGVIYSVEPLAKEKLAAFEEEVSKLLGNNIELENLTDPSLIGGVRIMVDGRIIDASIQSRINRLAHEIRH